MSTSGTYFVYILASRKYGALYIGVTGNLPARTYIHREALVPGLPLATASIGWSISSSTTTP